MRRSAGQSKVPPGLAGQPLAVEGEDPRDAEFLSPDLVQRLPKRSCRILRQVWA